MLVLQSFLYKKHLKNAFDTVSVEGLCTLVPPSYIQGFVEKHPKLYRFLQKKEDRWKSKWPWKNIGDYYIITLQKKSLISSNYSGIAFLIASQLFFHHKASAIFPGKIPGLNGQNAYR